MKSATSYWRYILTGTCLFVTLTFQSYGQCPGTGNFRLSQLFPSGPICFSQPVTLEAEYLLPFEGASAWGEFRWYSSSNGFSSPVRTSEVDLFTTLKSTYTVQATTSALEIRVAYYDNFTGCESSMEPYPYSIQVESAATVSQVYGRRCGNGPAEIQVSSNKSEVTFELYWRTPSNSYSFLESNTSGHFEVQDPNMYGLSNFFVKISQPSGCGASGYNQLSIHSDDAAEPLVSGVTTYCYGLGTTLTASGTGPFTWYNQNGNIVSQSSSLVIPTNLAPGTYSYSVIRTSSGGCQSPAASVAVVVNPRPVDPGSVQTSSTSICLGESVRIQPAGDGVGSPYYWCSNNGGIDWNVFQADYGGQNHIDFTPTQAGTYRFLVRNKTVCGFCWENGNNNCPTNPYVDVIVSSPSVGGTTKSVATGQVTNTVSSRTFGATVLEGRTGSVLGWEYAINNPAATYTPWGQAGLTTTSETCCVEVTQTIYIRARVKSGACAVALSEATSYYLPAIPPSISGTSQVKGYINIPVTLPTNVQPGNGAIQSYSWVQLTSLSTSSVTGGNTQQLSFTPLEVGNYIFKLTVTDIYGITASFQVTIQVVIPNNYNYVKETTVLANGMSENGLKQAGDFQKSISTNYLDDLGRPIQTVKWSSSPAGHHDMIEVVGYDAAGRQHQQFLPYTSDEENGWYKANALRDPMNPSSDEVNQYRSGEQHKFYQQGGDIAKDLFPYSVTKFDYSPLNRVIKQSPPGEAWQSNNDTWSINDKTIKKNYGNNAALEILLFHYDASNGMVALSSAPELKYYQQNTLYKNISLDEQNNETVEFFDQEGRVICKNVQYATVGGIKKYASTYYLYDELGNLVVVLPPEAVNTLNPPATE